MNFLENLKANNQFPIIFIGSGITQRYFENAPTWDKLLIQIWEESDTKGVSYYYRYNQLKREFKDDKFKIYTTIADELEELYDDTFYAGKVAIQNLTPEIAHDEHISPFRRRIAEIFSNLKIREDKKDELIAFKEMLTKARFIITTNYDDFIEKQLNNTIKVRVGNKGLFESSGTLNELFKIHGSIKDSNSIVITSEDYELMERNSAVVNAKILNNLIDSPILFIGYSMTDKNVVSLLDDLTRNMPFPRDEIEKRIGIIEYSKDKEDIFETSKYIKNDIYCTRLITDNFKAIYNAISEINQGITPAEIAKYQNAFKQIINTKGQAGELDKVLTSFVDLKDLPRAMQNKNLVVAFGNDTYLYRVPSYVDYIKSYFSDEPMPAEIAIKFILSTSPQSTLPISRYLTKDIDLNDEDRKKLNKRLKQFYSLQSLQNSIAIPKSSEDILKTYKDKSAIEIFQTFDGIKPRTKLGYIIKNIDKINAKPLIDYILENETEIFIKETTTRKLFMAYSLLTEEIFKEI